jgi:peptidyl-prolyl cis-trans isomerase A (cyclophilin A)
MKSMHWVVGVVMLANAAVVTAQAPAAGQPPQKQAAEADATAKKAPVAAAGAVFNQALLKPALLTDKAPEVFDAKFETTKGDFTVRVTRAWAPLGADRFYNLVKHHFYDGASFFRVLDGFVVQVGISAYPQVSATWKETTIKDDPVKQSNRKSYVTFATGGPNTRTTQVFVNLGDNTRLDSMGFSPFGQVTEGMVTVVKLYGGYGEGAPQGNGPDQGKIEKLGKPYLDKGWPKLDSIKKATIVSPAADSGSSAQPPAAKKQ